MPVPAVQPRTLSIAKASRTYTIPRPRLYELIEDGTLRRIQLGPRSVRLYVEDIEQFLADNVTNRPEVAS